jgi:hypothetical protein
MSEAWSSVRQDTALLQRLQQRKQHAHDEAAFFGGSRPRTSAVSLQHSHHQQKLRVSRLLHTSKGRSTAAAKQQRSATAGSLWAPLIRQDTQQVVSANARGELSASLRAAAGESTLPSLQWVDFFASEADSSAALSNSWDGYDCPLLKSMQQLGSCKAHSAHCGCVKPGTAARFKVCSCLYMHDHDNISSQTAGCAMHASEPEVA